MYLYLKVLVKDGAYSAGGLSEEVILKEFENAKMKEDLLKVTLIAMDENLNQKILKEYTPEG